MFVEGWSTGVHHNTMYSRVYTLGYPGVVVRGDPDDNKIHEITDSTPCGFRHLAV